MIEKKADYLFEVSWEICNKYGGIYTVITSKIAQMVEHYGHNYFLIGPYFADRAKREFSAEVPPKEMKKVFDELKGEGIIAHYGKWLVKHYPNVILVEFSKFFENKNEIKKQMWEDYKIDSLNSPGDYDEPVIWSYAAGRMIEKLCETFQGSKVVHCHEWLAGGVILYLKKKKCRIGTVFTTHATVLGRTLAGSNVEIYNTDESNKFLLEKLDINKESYNYHVEAKHQLEKQSALNACVFTTVSEITALEAKYILGRDADLLTHNGLDFSTIPDLETAQIKHREHRETIREFVLSYFFPYYAFDIENTLFYYISGRYEFKNKGLDVTIKALARLNEMLKKNNIEKTVVVFFFIPAGIQRMNLGLLESKSSFEDIMDFVDNNLKDIKEKIIYSIASKKLPTIKIFEKDFLLELKKNILGFEKKGNPPLSTYELVNENNDPILKSFKELKLLNDQSDKVKVILYPSYLSNADGLLDLDYYSVIMGCHLGIFPSYYEPWGYTPLESAAYAVPAITTDLAGFGRFALKHPEEQGIFVIKRQGKDEEDVVKQLTNILYKYLTSEKKKRISYKVRAAHFAQLCGWRHLIEDYIKAHNLALERIKN